MKLSVRATPPTHTHTHKTKKRKCGTRGSFSTYKGCAGQVANECPPQSLAGVSLSAFLTGCADQVAYAAAPHEVRSGCLYGPPPNVWQEWNFRRS
jgi:hypothetical protein